MMTTITIAAVTLASVLGVAIAASLHECAQRPTLLPVRARRRNRR